MSRWNFGELTKHLPSSGLQPAASFAPHSTPAPDKDRVAGWRIILAPKLPRLCKERAYVRRSFLLRRVTD
jgi:hypothetical protein